MAGDFPIMQAYRRPVSTRATVDSDESTAAVSRPVPQNTPKEGLCWIQTGEEWSRILAHTTEHCRRYQLERLAAEKAREARESLPIPRTTGSFCPAAPPRTESETAAWIEEAKIWSRDFAQNIERREMREKAHARFDADVANLASYKLMWSMLYAGLVMSAFLFLILFTGVLQDTGGSQLGVSTTCDAVPSLMEISLLSLIYWTAVVLYVIARLAAPMAAGKAAALSQVVGRSADAAYYRRQSQHRIILNQAGVLVVFEALIIGFLALMQGDIRCEGVTGDRCLWVALMTPMIMCWRFLGSTVSVLFLGSEYGSLLEWVF